jgi:aubergine-like protein
MILHAQMFLEMIRILKNLMNFDSQRIETDLVKPFNPQASSKYSNEFLTFSRQHYGITIDDVDQPLLLNRPKTKAKRDGAKESTENDMVCLIPELCCMTGLTDEIRKDFRIMKEMAVHTRVAPTQRYESLKMFIENIRNTPRALRHLTNWGLELDDDTVVVGYLLRFFKFRTK